ncbi:hypothetical protein [Lentibacillus sp.]|uniref:hypothetical protein n=1 Tax=Lentibacillus sp. TaxID=1925746 RepID=UPI002B4B488E|nr:hypothetical protein [Lentibacillus sp.]HLS07745.1 hypothetical protein [Lentibacillus sp.]
MFQFQIDENTMDQIADNIATQAFEKFSKKIDGYMNLPVVLNREQLKEVLDIKNNKVSELLNREDFPVLRDTGRPKIPSKQLLVWIDQNTEWVGVNTGQNSIFKVG